MVSGALPLAAAGRNGERRVLDPRSGIQAAPLDAGKSNPCHRTERPQRRQRSIAPHAVMRPPQMHMRGNAGAGVIDFTVGGDTLRAPRSVSRTAGGGQVM